MKNRPKIAKSGISVLFGALPWQNVIVTLEFIRKDLYMLFAIFFSSKLDTSQKVHRKGVPNFFKDKCSDEFLVQSSLNFCYICYSVTGVTKCVCWKICVLFVKYLQTRYSDFDQSCLVYVQLSPHKKTNKMLRRKQSNCTADQRLCFRHMDSTISLFLKTKISSF